jgi:NAD(P)-dependent dehydrogenase (short-subunit alcohol dehydrogenase family)
VAVKTIPNAFAAGFLRGRAALITGASSGIGRDVAKSFAAMGARVALLARRKPMLEDLAEEITAAGGAPLVLAADVTRKESCTAAVDRAISDLGHLDILINSAGILESGPVEKLDHTALERMMRVNLYGTLNMMQAVLPSMRKAGSGNIVNIASLAGRRGMPPLGGYCATKFAVVGLTEALRVELFGSGVKVSLVMPGVTDTPMTQKASGAEALQSVYAMPVRWVTWAVIAAIVFGLTEVDVPPGVAILEKVAALFPGISDGALAFGLRLAEWTRLGREKWS